MAQYHVNPGVVARQLRGTCVLIPIAASFEQLEGLYTLNETARFVWEQARAGLDTDAIAEVLARTYEVPEATAAADVRAVLAELCERDLLRMTQAEPEQ